MRLAMPSVLTYWQPPSRTGSCVPGLETPLIGLAIPSGSANRHSSPIAILRILGMPLVLYSLALLLRTVTGFENRIFVSPGRQGVEDTARRSQAGQSHRTESRPVFCLGHIPQHTFHPAPVWHLEMA